MFFCEASSLCFLNEIFNWFYISSYFYFNLLSSANLSWAFLFNVSTYIYTIHNGYFVAPILVQLASFCRRSGARSDWRGSWWDWIRAWPISTCTISYLSAGHQQQTAKCYTTESKVQIFLLLCLITVCNGQVREVGSRSI